MRANILLPHVRRNTLPAGFLDTPSVGRVSVVTEPGHAQRYGPEIDVHMVDSAQDVDQVRRKTMQILGQREIHRVLAPFELSVPVAGYLRSYFGLPGMGFETANLFTNKYLMKRRLSAAGLPVAAFRVAHSVDELLVKATELRWPVVVKPVFGGGGLDTVILNGPEDYGRFRARSAEHPVQRAGIPLIVEKCLTLEAEYHCNGIVHDSDVVFTATMKYPVPLLGCPAGLSASFTLPPGHPDLAEITRLHAQTVHALGLEAGVTHMEVLKTSAGLHVGEIACRPPGGGIPGGIHLQYGVDVWQVFRDTSLGLRPHIHASQRDELVAIYLLPIKRGRIVRLSTAADFSAIPSVLRVDMHKRVGDVMRDRVGASAVTGIVYFTVREEAEVWERMQELARRYVIEIAEDGGAEGDVEGNHLAEESPCYEPMA